MPTMKNCKRFFPIPVRFLLLALPALGLTLLLGGCLAMMDERRFQSSSVAEFLYPNSVHLEEPRLPHLHLPLRVGISFVPRQSRGTPFPGAGQAALADSVAEAFRGLHFVDDITVIPPTYLRSQGSFANLDQIRRFFQVDVIILLGYDQMQVMDSSLASIAVWTIAGAFIVPSERTGTHTLMEAVVFDIASRSLLFRAAGTNVIDDTWSTAVGQERRLRQDAEHSFHAAAEDLVYNLRLSLTDFERRVRERPDDFVVTRRPGYTGAGSFGGIGAVGLCLLLVLVGAFHRFHALRDGV